MAEVLSPRGRYNWWRRRYDWRMRFSWDGKGFVYNLILLVEDRMGTSSSSCAPSSSKMEYERGYFEEGRRGRQYSDRRLLRRRSLSTAEVTEFQMCRSSAEAGCGLRVAKLIKIQACRKITSQKIVGGKSIMCRCSLLSLRQGRIL